MHINLLIYVIFKKSLQRYNKKFTYARIFVKKVNKTCVYAIIVVILYPEMNK